LLLVIHLYLANCLNQQTAFGHFTQHLDAFSLNQPACFTLSQSVYGAAL